MERCLKEIAAIEVKLRGGNPDVMGLLLALADWHTKLRILQDRERIGNAEGSPENRKFRTGVTCV
jgi:hypothetical protein